WGCGRNARLSPSRDAKKQDEKKQRGAGGQRRHALRKRQAQQTRFSAVRIHRTIPSFLLADNFLYLLDRTWSVLESFGASKEWRTGRAAGTSKSDRADRMRPSGTRPF